MTVFRADGAVCPVDHEFGALILGNAAGVADGVFLGVKGFCYFAVPFATDAPRTVVRYDMLILARINHLLSASIVALRRDSDRKEVRGMDIDELRRELESGEYRKRIAEEIWREFRFERLFLLCLLILTVLAYAFDF